MKTEASDNIESWTEAHITAIQLQTMQLIVLAALTCPRILVSKKQ